MNVFETKRLFVKDEKPDKPAEISLIDKKTIDFSIYKACNAPFPEVSVDFRGNSYVLSYNKKEYVLPKFVDLIVTNPSQKNLENCLSIESDSKTQIKFEYEGIDTKLDIYWSFNSSDEDEESKSEHLKFYLTENFKTFNSNFVFLSFSYPKFTKEAIFLSVSDRKFQGSVTIQAIYFNEDLEKGILIHSKDEPLIAKNAPIGFYFIKNLALTQSSFPLHSFDKHNVSYLSDDEIVYNINMICTTGLTPEVKVLDYENSKLLIECNLAKSLSAWIFTSDQIKKNKTELTTGLITVYDQLLNKNKKFI